MRGDLERRGDARGMAPTAHSQGSTISVRLRVGGFILRALFLGVLLALTVRVSIPQSEHFWSAYETPGDLVRIILGAAVSAAILFQLFRLPEDAESYRTWFYFGLFAVPFTLIFAIGVW